MVTSFPLKALAGVGKWRQAIFSVTGDTLNENFPGTVSTGLKWVAWSVSSCLFEIGPHVAQDGLQVIMQQRMALSF